MSEAPAETLLTTPLDALHRSMGARMVPFAGYAMPVQYPSGVIAEHNAVRNGCGLFDVSHMGQWRIGRKPGGEDPAAALERLVIGDLLALAPGRVRYTLFTNESGGALDDLMITRIDADNLFVVVNAGCKQADLAHVRAQLGDVVEIEVLEDRALLALQGPKAAAAIAPYCADAGALEFMSAAWMEVAGVDCFVTRSGYTGEDGYEISVPNEAAAALFHTLLDEDIAAPCGLGARDSLRLEAGLCLYGHELTPEITPIQAGLAWTLSKRRRAEGGFPGHAVIARELAEGPAVKRVGIKLLGRQPAREGAPLHRPGEAAPCGALCSGGYGPTLGGPIGMAYVPPELATPGTALEVMVRGKALAAEVVALPFTPHRYRKAS